jgi:hypothetical protein
LRQLPQTDKTYFFGLLIKALFCFWGFLLFLCYFQNTTIKIKQQKEYKTELCTPLGSKYENQNLRILAGLLKTLLATEANLLAGAGVAEWLSRQPRDQTKRA